MMRTRGDVAERERVEPAQVLFSRVTPQIRIILDLESELKEWIQIIPYQYSSVVGGRLRNDLVTVDGPGRVLIRPRQTPPQAP